MAEPVEEKLREIEWAPKTPRTSFSSAIKVRSIAHEEEVMNPTNVTSLHPCTRAVGVDLH